jgi:hypothetical protein
VPLYYYESIVVCLVLMVKNVLYYFFNHGSIFRSSVYEYKGIFVIAFDGEGVTRRRWWRGCHREKSLGRGGHREKVQWTGHR